MLTGHAAAQFAGPGSLVISFAIAGLGCLFAGLCYSEYASMIPVAGSAYTYTYATLGRFLAWIIGWNLVLEYLTTAGHGREWAGRDISAISWRAWGSVCRIRWPQPPLPPRQREKWR